MQSNLKLNLSRLRAYIDSSNQSNSTNDKIAVLEQYKDDIFVKKVLHYTYNNQLQFNISVDNLKKNADICAPENMYNAEDEDGGNLFALLDDLHERNVTGHAAISVTNAFFKEYAEYERELSYIINRNLQTRVTATIINKTIKGLIPEFEVALGEDYDSLDETKKRAEKALKENKLDPYEKDNSDATLLEAMMKQYGDKYDKRPNIFGSNYLASRKMDGLRALALVDDNGDTVFKSREGNTFYTFDLVAAKIKEMGFKNIILDGEMCLIKPDGSDDFNGMQKEFRKKNHTIENARYRLFDVLTYEEFKARKSTVILSERQARWNKYEFNETVLPIEQIRITSKDQFEALRQESADKGWEGLIVRKDAEYEGRRTKNLLKVKLFLEGEFLVTDVEFTLQRVIENGKEITKEMLGAVFVDYNGVSVRVGSGYSKEEREKYHADKHLILNKMITVQYFEETENKQGTNKMRFPTFKRVHEKF